MVFEIEHHPRKPKDRRYTWKLSHDDNLVCLAPAGFRSVEDACADIERARKVFIEAGGAAIQEPEKKPYYASAKRLKAAPLIAAMAQFQAEHNLDDLEFNVFLGYSRKSGRWTDLKKQEIISLELADRILVLMEQPGRLNELWPHLEHTYDERQL